jgi:hypothetical protein
LVAGYGGAYLKTHNLKLKSHFCAARQLPRFQAESKNFLEYCYENEILRGVDINIKIYNMVEYFSLS